MVAAFDKCTLKKWHVVTCIYSHYKKFKHRKANIPSSVSPKLPSPTVITAKNFLHVHIDCSLYIYRHVDRVVLFPPTCFYENLQTYRRKNYRMKPLVTTYILEFTFGCVSLSHITSFIHASLHSSINSFFFKKCILMKVVDIKTFHSQTH